MLKIFSPEDGDSMFPWNVGTYLKVHVVLWSRRLTSASFWLLQPHVSFMIALLKYKWDSFRLVSGHCNKNCSLHNHTCSVIGTGHICLRVWLNVECKRDWSVSHLPLEWRLRMHEVVISTVYLHVMMLWHEHIVNTEALMILSWQCEDCIVKCHY
jgi:hypothetical protein